MNFVSDYTKSRFSPVYIKFNCSGDFCNEDFFMVVWNKYFVNLQYATLREIPVEEIVCCPHCGHIQILNITSFLHLDEDKYFAI